MQVIFSKAKDETQTFSVDGVFFHSTYSPLKEAQRFIQNITFAFTPDYIFFIEPGLNYYNAIIKEKFPNSKTICIRLFDQPLGDEATWDYCIKYSDIANFKAYLINNFGEEKLLSSTIIFSKPAEALFQNQISQIIGQYKLALEDSKTLLVTRQFFEKKWLLNCCNFIKYAANFSNIEKRTSLPVVVCASGPSLEPCLKLLKASVDKVFIVCLSSATSVLLQNNIIPDIILSTDGGWWAGEHLKLLKKNKAIPVAAPCEAFIPKTILKNNPIIPLKYNDSSSFVSSEILDQSVIPFYSALRNPTVSGTALFFAQSITQNKIFFCGLDLQGGKGTQHTKPNEIEKDNSIKDSRIKNIETRISYSRYNSDSLKIYREWFCELNDVENVYRVIDINQSALGKIKDITSKEFETMLSEKKTDIHKAQIFLQTQPSAKTKSTFEYIIQNLKTQKWQKQIFPADYLSLNNCNDETQKQISQQRLNSKVEKLIAKIRTIADE